MRRFIIKRLMQSGLLIFLVLTITFFLLHFAPGDPMAKYYNRTGISPETVEMMRVKFGLDKPVGEQYIKWVASFIRGDFGFSIHYNRPVRDIIFEAIPNTLRLTIAALLLYIVIGISLGIFSAVKKDTLFDKVNTVIALFLYSIPSFWLSLMLIFLFSLKLGILPSSHMQSIGMQGAGWFELLCDRARHLVMPAFVLGVASAAGMARYMRGSMLDVLREDYIRTARAKGLENKSVILKHAFRNAAIPVVTIIGLSIPFLLGGAVVVEKIFSWPGMGRLAVDAIYARDYPIVLAVNFVVGVMVILGNLMADIGYALLDPRITVTERSEG